MSNTFDRPLINGPMLLKTMGWLLMIEAAFMLIPAVISIIYGEADWRGYVISAGITALVGFVMTSRIRPRYSNMGRREGFLLTASVWVIFSAFGMLPFLINIPGITVSDAFFETMSGFTTTGATVLPADTTINHGTHLWRALTQWIGGMGIILFTLAVVPMLNSSGGMQMFNAEVTGITHDKVRPRISQTAKALWVTYFTLTAAAFVCLWVGPMNWFDSLCHAFGTMSTGGYTTAAEGVDGFNSVYVYVILTLFMYLGGVNFALIIRSVSQGPRIAWRSEVLRTFTLSILLAFALFFIIIGINNGFGDWQELTIKPMFQIVSLFTSTGYTVDTFATWGFFALAVMLIIMFVGGCAGSTSGGVKIDRMILICKYCRNEIRRCVHPNAVLTVKLNGRVQPGSLVSKVIAFICLYVGVMLLGALLVIMFGENPQRAFFSTFSCMSNSGLSAGDAVCSNDFSMLCDASKWVLSSLMLIGRLELYTILILLTHAFWRR